jgi:type I restriction enzyme R subunit
MEYPHEQAVADGVNVNYDIYRIRTRITQAGSKVDAGYFIDKRDRETRAVRWERLDEELEYNANQLDTDVVAIDQIRTVIKSFRDNLFKEIFPGRKDVPKTLVFAKDDSHAEDIVKIIREEFAKGNEFCQKITYKTTGVSPEQLIRDFRTNYFPRIAVTVDMISTGTDIKPLEIVFFMRNIKSRSFFEQMKGRGVRVINPNELQSVTPDAMAKTHFIIVDAVGVCEQDKTDSRPMEKRPSISLEKLLQAVALGNTEQDVIEKRLSREEKEEIKKINNGQGIKDLMAALVQSIDPDRHIESAKTDFGNDAPSEEQIKQASNKIIKEAVKPLHNPELRKKIIELHKTLEQTIDIISKDEVVAAGFDADALEKAQKTVTSFEQFIKEHKDEITAIQILYSRPYKARLRFEDIKALSEVIEKPPYLWRVDRLWDAYAALERSKVRGASSQRILTDLVSLIRFAIRHDELEPFSEHVHERFNKWIILQESAGKKFAPEQIRWLEMIRDHIVANLSIEKDDFNYVPFAQEGGIGKAYQLFGEQLWPLLDEINEALAA